MSNESFPNQPDPPLDTSPHNGDIPSTPTVKTDSSLSQETLDRFFHEAHDNDCDFLYISRNNPYRRRLVLVAEDYDATQIVRILVDASE